MSSEPLNKSWPDGHAHMMSIRSMVDAWRRGALTTEGALRAIRAYLDDAESSDDD
jgi:hypothetical protein